VGIEESRSSDRVYLELTITLTGPDAAGREFTEETITLAVNRRGGKIMSRYALVPNQKLRIRCSKTGRESDMRVVGHIGGDREGYYYGIEVLDAGGDFWGINFPPLASAEQAAGRLLLECSVCHSQEVAHLDVFDLEVLLVNECLMRLCSRCGTSTVWTPPTPGCRPPVKSEPPPLSSRPAEGKKQDFIQYRVDVCIRHPAQGDEVVFTEYISRGGFRFRSSKDYPIATPLEAALPYTPGAANIFAPVRIIFREENPAHAKRAYGVYYVPTKATSSSARLGNSTPG